MAILSNAVFIKAAVAGVAAIAGGVAAFNFATTGCFLGTCSEEQGADVAAVSMTDEGGCSLGGCTKDADTADVSLVSAEGEAECEKACAEACATECSAEQMAACAAGDEGAKACCAGEMDAGQTANVNLVADTTEEGACEKSCSGEKTACTGDAANVEQVAHTEESSCSGMSGCTKDAANVEQVAHTTEDGACEKSCSGEKSDCHSMDADQTADAGEVETETADG